MLFVIIIFIRRKAISQAKPLPIATGEWLPYVSESASDPGIFRKILDEVFKLMNAKPQYEFYPWKRAEYQTEKGYNFAAFPYIKTLNAARNLIFLIL